MTREKPDPALEKLAEEAKKRGSAPSEESTVDVYVVVRIHGELFVTSFWSAIAPTAEALWDGILEYVAVEVQWWCDDRKLPTDAEALARPPLYRLDPEQALLDPITERAQMQAYCDNEAARRFPLALFSSPPDAVMLEQLKLRYEQVNGKAVAWRLPR